MNALEIAHYRLLNQHIARQRFERPDQVVSWLGAMQAQGYAGAKWSVGLRLPSATDGVIERALADKTIIRTWPLTSLSFATFEATARRRCVISAGGPDWRPGILGLASRR